MDLKTVFALVLVAYITIMASVEGAKGRSHGLKYHHQYHSHSHNSNHNRNRQNHPYLLADGSNERTFTKHTHSNSWRPSDEDYEDDTEDDQLGRHSYLMSSKDRKSSNEDDSEDQTLNQAFDKHMKPGASNAHDVYAYQLPSDLWFMVRYARDKDGRVQKYMNVVDSFTNYLEKLEDKDVQTVSVNVKGVETVFRLTPKKRKSEDN